MVILVSWGSRHGYPGFGCVRVWFASHLIQDVNPKDKFNIAHTNIFFIQDANLKHNHNLANPNIFRCNEIEASRSMVSRDSRYSCTGILELLGILGSVVWLSCGPRYRYPGVRDSVILNL